MALIDNIAGYWKFDESSGNAADSVNSNTLTNVNTAVYSAGEINNGVDLESTLSQYLFCADNIPLSITGDLTISVWVKLESAPTGTFYFVCSKDDFGSPSNLVSYFLDVNGASAVMRFGVSDTGSPSRETTASSTTGVSTGIWTHIAVVYTASTGTCKFYKNGAYLTGEDGSALRTSIADTAQEFMVGTVENNGTPFSYLDGMIDELGVWARALSDAEITSLYNSGSGFQYPFAGGATTTPTPQLLTLGCG